MVLASWRGSRTVKRDLPVYPPPEYMTVAQAAAFFSVNATMLANVLNHVGMPVLSQDSWGNPMYSREAIREQLGR
jgi:hypothetical protein